MRPFKIDAAAKVIVLYWSAGMSNIEIAKDVGIHRNTVGNILRHIKYDPVSDEAQQIFNASSWYREMVDAGRKASAGRVQVAEVDEETNKRNQQ